MYVSKWLVVGLLTISSLVASKSALATCQNETANFESTVAGCRDKISGLEFTHDRAQTGAGSNSLAFAKSDCASIGFRVPTLAELKSAHAHGIANAVILGGNSTPGTYFLWWSTTAKGKNSSVLDLRSGVQYSINTARSYIFWVCVR